MWIYLKLYIDPFDGVEVDVTCDIRSRWLETCLQLTNILNVMMWSLNSLSPKKEKSLFNIDFSLAGMGGDMVEASIL